MVEMRARPEKTPTGGCLRRSWRLWWRLSPQAGRWTKEGVRLPWLRTPRPCNRQQRALSTEEVDMLERAIQDMLDKKAIYQRPNEGCVTSSIYTLDDINRPHRLFLGPSSTGATIVSFRSCGRTKLFPFEYCLSASLSVHFSLPSCTESWWSTFISWVCM